MSDEEMGTQRASMIATGDGLKDVLDPMFARLGYCYALIIFPPQPPGFGRFVTNAPTQRMTETIREMVARIEAGDVIDEGGD